MSAKIVVIGSGTMGLDIAQAFAKKNFDVVVRDIKEEDCCRRGGAGAF